MCQQTAFMALCNGRFNRWVLERIKIKTQLFSNRRGNGPVDGCRPTQMDLTTWRNVIYCKYRRSSFRFHRLSNELWSIVWLLDFSSFSLFIVRYCNLDFTCSCSPLSVYFQRTTSVKLEMQRTQHPRNVDARINFVWTAFLQLTSGIYSKLAAKDSINTRGVHSTRKMRNLISSQRQCSPDTMTSSCRLYGTGLYSLSSGNSL